MIRVYVSKVETLPGSNAGEIYQQALVCYKEIRRRTKRRPYVRSNFFHGEKVFLDIFWQHMRQKNWSDRSRRLRYYPCALDLIRFTSKPPTKKLNPNNPKETLYRFQGITKSGKLFFVQIQENQKTKQKYFMSVFPKA